MMWQKKRLSVSPSAAGMVCSVVDVHPWTPEAGHKEDTGLYLSPANAVTSLAKKLAAAPSVLDVIAMMVTAPTLAGFITELTALAVVFPAPAVTAAARRAVTAASLPTSRMQIPAPSAGLPPAVPLSVSTLTNAANAAAMAGKVSRTVTSDAAAALKTFSEKRAEMLAVARRSLTARTASPVTVHALSAQADTPGAVRAMRENIPHPDHVFALCLVFLGEDLAPLREMLQDE